MAATTKNTDNTDSPAVDAVNSPEPVAESGTLVEGKERDAIAREYLETGLVRKGHTLRYETRGGETSAVVEKVA